MKLKEYQASALDTFTRWLEFLADARAETLTRISALKNAEVTTTSEDRNYPKMAWKEMDRSGYLPPTAGAYVSRTDGAGRPIPHTCFKIPTGGGKTLMAASALERLNRQTGLTLWLIPTKAIFDSGHYPTLFPDIDDRRSEAVLLEKHPDLERSGEEGPIKRSLFNVFKMLRLDA